MKVSDLMDDLEKGDRTEEHLKKPHSDQGTIRSLPGDMTAFEFARMIGDVNLANTMSKQSALGQSANQQIQVTQQHYAYATTNNTAPAYNGHLGLGGFGGLNR